MGGGTWTVEFRSKFGIVSSTNSTALANSVRLPMMANESSESINASE